MEGRWRRGREKDGQMKGRDRDMKEEGGDGSVRWPWGANEEQERTVQRKIGIKKN